MNILSWKVSRDFASPCLDRENLSESNCMSYGIFFHANAVSFLSIGLPSGTRSIWILVTLSTAGSCPVGRTVSALYYYWKSVEFNLSGFVSLSSGRNPAALESLFCIYVSSPSPSIRHHWEVEILSLAGCACDWDLSGFFYKGLLIFCSDLWEKTWALLEGESYLLLPLLTEIVPLQGCKIWINSCICHWVCEFGQAF